MKVWYNSEKRFNTRIIKQWTIQKFNYNARHVNILSYAYRTATFWAMINSNKISEKNKLKGYPKLF